MLSVAERRARCTAPASCSCRRTDWVQVPKGSSPSRKGTSLILYSMKARTRTVCFHPVSPSVHAPSCCPHRAASSQQFSRLGRQGFRGRGCGYSMAVPNRRSIAVPLDYSLEPACSTPPARVFRSTHARRPHGSLPRPPSAADMGHSTAPTCPSTCRDTAFNNREHPDPCACARWATRRLRPRLQGAPPSCCQPQPG